MQIYICKNLISLKENFKRFKPSKLFEECGLKKELKINPILFSGVFYIIAGCYGLILTILLATNLIPFYLLHALILIIGFQILRKRKWAANISLFLFPLMFIFSISTLWYYLGGGINVSLSINILNLTLIFYAAFALISTFLIIASWKEFK